MKDNEFSNIAVFIDAENISHIYLKKIFESIAAFGQISVKRIYADWTDQKRNSWKPLIHEYSLIPIQQFENKESKNVSDFTLVIDAMDLLHEGIFDCFCIVSSDSDFTRLAQRIREKGKKVIGLGEKKALKPFVNACNTFIYIDEEMTKEETMQKSEAKNDEEYTIDMLMKIALSKLADQDGWVQLVKLIPYLKQIKPDFNLSDCGINRLSNYFKNKYYELKDENTYVREKK